MVTIESIQKSCWTAQNDTDFTLKVLILYEDFTSGLRGKDWFDRISHQLQHEARLEVQLWRFDVIGALAFREQASLDAANADIIVLCPHTSLGVSAELRHWLRQCLSLSSDRSRALVVLLEESEADPARNSQLLTALNDLAHESHLVLFCQFCETHGPEWTWSIGRITERAEQSSTVLEEILHHGAQ